MTTPESSPSPVGAEDTSSLRERIAAAIAAEDLRMDARSRREPDYDGVEARTEAVMREVESAHGDLVVRNAVLRSERDALARDVERLAERRVVLQRDCARAWDALYPVVRWPVDQTVHSGLPGVAQRAADEIRDLRAELARVSGAHTIPDDAAAQVAAVRHLHRGFRIYGECGHQHKEEGNGVISVESVGLTCADGYEYSICRECCTGGSDYQTEECATNHDRACWPCSTVKVLGLSTPATDPAPAPAELDRWVRWLCDAYGPAEVAAAVRQADPAPAAADGLTRLLWTLALTEERFVSEFGTGPSETRDALHEVMRQANAMAAAPQAPAQPPKNTVCDFCTQGSPYYCSCPPGREDTATPGPVVHNVTILAEQHDDYFVARCTPCGFIAGDTNEQWVQDRADAHRADTLRPSGPLAPIRHEEE